jgi:hypothetical protein
MQGSGVEASRGACHDVVEEQQGRIKISKAKFGASDIYSGGVRYDSFTWMKQHENGTGPGS